MDDHFLNSDHGCSSVVRADSASDFRPNRLSDLASSYRARAARVTGSLAREALVEMAKDCEKQAAKLEFRPTI